MPDSRHCSAPWGKLLTVFTAISLSMMAGLVVVSASIAPAPWPMIVIASVALLTGVCALCMVRGYRIEGDTLCIERLGWVKRVSLVGLRRATHHTALIHGAVRVGNGGFFVFAGWFWSRKLGWFHLVGNDILGRAVLLELPDAKWMITPDDPDAFVTAVSELINTESG